jgi:hypothetical protein
LVKGASRCFIVKSGYLIFSRFSTATGSLRTEGTEQVSLKAAFCPSTLQGHRHAVMVLALFCLFHDVQFPGISIFTLLSFIEFLLDSNLSIPTVKNYVSSVKSAFKSSNISIEVFNSQQLSLALASLNKAWRPAVSSKPVFSPSQFPVLISHCTRLPLHVFLFC